MQRTLRQSLARLSLFNYSTALNSVEADIFSHEVVRVDCLSFISQKLLRWRFNDAVVHVVVRNYLL